MANYENQADWSYLYGRVSGMHKHLLSADKIKSLEKAANQGEFEKRLKETPYLLSGDVLKPFNLHFFETVSLVSSFAPKKQAKEIASFFKTEHEKNAVKLIISQTYYGAAPTEGHRRLAADPLLSPQLEDIGSTELAKLPSRLPEPYDEIVKQSLQLAASDLGLAEALDLFEENLTKHYMSAYCEALGEYASLLADVRNTQNILRCMEHSLDFREYLIDFGLLLDPRRLSSMGSDKQVKSHLMSTVFKDVVKKSYDPVTLYIDLLDRLSSHLHELARQNPLSIYSALEFLHKKRVESMRVEMIYAQKTLEVSS